MELRDHKAWEVPMERMGQRATPVQQAQPAHKVIQEPLDLQVPQDLQVLQE